MKTGDLAKKFGVSTETIRRWTREFESFFSDQDGRFRNFTAEDYKVVATIHSLLNDGHNLKYVEQQLGTGFRVDDAYVGTLGYDDGRQVPAAAVEQIVDASKIRAELEVIKMEKEKLQERLDDREQELRNLRVQLDREKRELLAKRDAEFDEWKSERQILQEQINRLNEEIKALYERLIERD